MQFFKKREKVLKVSSKFNKNIRKAIILLLNADNSQNNDMILDLFQKNGINSFDAVEILIFLPIAFHRKLYDHFKWPDTYMELDSGNLSEKKFTDSLSYRIIWEETEKYFQNLPVSRDILKVVMRSAEFNALNTLLLQNPEAKADEIILSKAFIRR
jgi:acyl carrier protein